MIKLEDLRKPLRTPEKSTLDKPLDHLVACHRRIEERLSTFERIGPFWETKPGEAMQAAENCFRFFDTNGLWHTEDEEQSLFPRLEAGLTDEERSFLSTLESQHVEADAALNAVRKMVERLARPPVEPNAVAQYREAVERLCVLYRAHIASEDKHLQEIGRRLLSSAGLAEISREMKKRRGLS